MVAARDPWLEQYTAVVPARLGPEGARVLLDLLSADHSRLAEALVALSGDVDWCR